MKKAIKTIFIVCFFLGTGIYTHAQSAYCNNGDRYASCNSYGGGNAGGYWTLNCPTGNAQVSIGLSTYDQVGDAIVDVGGHPNLSYMYNIWGTYQSDGTNVYVSGIPSTVDLWISIYASSTATAYASVILF